MTYRKHSKILGNRTVAKDGKEEKKKEKKKSIVTHVESSLFTPQRHHLLESIQTPCAACVLYIHGVKISRRRVYAIIHL